jgi:hypothetical protein
MGDLVTVGELVVGTFVGDLAVDDEEEDFVGSLSFGGQPFLPQLEFPEPKVG